MPSLNQFFLELIDQAFDKTAWHGPNLMSALRGVTPQMAMRSINGRKTIWQHCLHAAYWKQRVLNKLTETTRFPRSPSNWPIPAHSTAAAWREDIALLQSIQVMLRQAIQSLPQSRLHFKTRRLLNGAACHDIYHAGQIKLLRRMM